MKNIVIAAGYATRLWELTKNFPKPLLKIGNSTILGRMLDDIDKIDDVDEHIIITNHKFAGIFEDWKKNLHYSKPITIVDDGTETNETRLGAVCDLLQSVRIQNWGGTFIGMHCYLDDLCYDKIEIGKNVTISYGVYFACHGRKQGHNKIIIED